MKNKTFLRTFALLISFVFLSSTSIAATSSNSFAINETTSNLWSFVPMEGGSLDEVQNQLHYLHGEKGYLFFVGSDEEMDFLIELQEKIADLYPNSRIIAVEGVIPFTFLNVMSNGEISPKKIDFVDAKSKVVVANWDFESERWTYYNEFDEDGNRYMLASSGEVTIIDDSELLVYENTPYDELLVETENYGEEIGMAGALSRVTVYDNGAGEWKPQTHLGKAAARKKLPKNWDDYVEKLKEWAKNQPKQQFKTELGKKAAKVKLPKNFAQQMEKIKADFKANPKPFARTSLGKAVLNPKVSTDLDKAIRRAKLRGRIGLWGTVGVIVAGYGTLGTIAFLKHRDAQKRKEEINRKNEELKAAEEKADSLNAETSSDSTEK